MNLIKISIMMKSNISKFYDIKYYRKQASEQIIVRNYILNNQKITIEGKK